MRKKMTILLAACLYAIMAAAQNDNPILIRGRVLSAADSIPVEGATIKLKGSTVAVLSNHEGFFAITYPKGSGTLMVSYVGYAPVEMQTTGGNTLFTIYLRPASGELQDVEISTGYQKVARERATGSFGRVSNRDIGLQVSKGILARLDGMAAGLQTDANTNRPALTIRGLGTISGPTAPLIVLDNFPYEGDINNINPNDVESVTLLKDAAAASIWGTRAGNGVIVITTKKGRYRQAMRVETNAVVTVEEKPGLFASKAFIAAADYIALEESLFEKGFYRSLENATARTALTPAVEIFIARRDGRINIAEADGMLASLRMTDVREQVTRHLYRPAVSQQYSIGLRGGADKATYYLSAGYDHGTDALGKQQDRLTLRTENSFRLAKGLELSTSLQYSQQQVASGRTNPADIAVAGKKPPYIQLADGAGNPLPVALDIRPSYSDTAGVGKLLDWRYVPLEEQAYNHNNTKTQDLLATAGLRWQPTSWLAANATYQFERQQAGQEYLRDAGSYFARNLVNRYSQLNRSTGVVTYPIPKGGILDNSHTELTVRNLRAQLDASPSWGKGQLNAIAGFDMRESTTDASAWRSYGYDSEVLTFGKVDLAGRYRDFVTGSNRAIPDITGYTGRLNRFLSWYGNAAFTYNGRYTVSASVRKDASNLFGVDANDRGVPLWSAGAAWNIGRESFYGIGWLPILRLRASWGMSGNVDQGKSAFTTLTMLSGALGTGYPYAFITQQSNPSLRWERVRTVNLGLDFTLRGSVLSGTLEYYRKNGFDLFGESPLDYTTGLNRPSLTRNVATIRGQGIDLTLRSQNLRGRLGWQTALLLGYNSNKVTDYYNAGTTGRDFISDGESIAPQVGKPVYQVVSYAWHGLDAANGSPVGLVAGRPSTDYAVIMGNGTDKDALVYSGPAVPLVSGSLQNTLEWRNLSVTASISYRLGYWFRKQSVNYGGLLNGSAGHDDYYRRWQVPGDEQHTQVPAFNYPVNGSADNFYLASEVLAARADNIRLQFINLAYNLNLGKKQKKASCQLYMNCSNLGIIWKAEKDVNDPDYQQLPPSRRFSLGIRTSF